MPFSIIALVSSLVLTAIFLPWLIIFMRSHHEGQEIRDEGPKWHKKKNGTPTMGGVIFILAATYSASLMSAASSTHVHDHVAAYPYRLAHGLSIFRSTKPFPFG